VLRVEGGIVVTYGPLVAHLVSYCVASRLQRGVLMWGDRRNEITQGEKSTLRYLHPPAQPNRTQNEGKLSLWAEGRRMEAWMWVYRDSLY
jgi:hypothetical protein